MRVGAPAALIQTSRLDAPQFRSTDLPRSISNHPRWHVPIVVDYSLGGQPHKAPPSGLDGARDNAAKLLCPREDHEVEGKLANLINTRLGIQEKHLA